ncbi:MAG: hypothetical protein Q7J85_01400, partial [Bacillota bacterium]|nr:hypothetical protein [Bacillota bacterium]
FLKNKKTFNIRRKYNKDVELVYKGNTKIILVTQKHLIFLLVQCYNYNNNNTVEIDVTINEPTCYRYLRLR